MPTTTKSDIELPPYEPQRILNAPFAERVELICRTWAAQVAPTPRVVMLAYWVKYFLLYIGGWAFFCSFQADYPGLNAGSAWAFTGDAFHRAILWSLFYEMAGFGCSMGPMNARFVPPVGGFLYFLRPGTTKLPMFPDAPLVGGITRNGFDVLLYAIAMIALLVALTAPSIDANLLLGLALLIPVFWLTDKTIFLAARSEHYWVALVCLVAAAENELWIAACKVLWCAIWFWAATSKLNQHFPSVIMFMGNNGPLMPRWLKQRLFVDYPRDLRPSRLASRMAHSGTVVEYAIPFVLLLAGGDATITTVMLCVMFCFHSFIALNNPNGMPIEWNILMVYGGIFLFGFNPDAHVAALAAAPLVVGFLAIWLLAIPLYGNFVPSRVSFLLSMRYYAGNWAYNIWLVRKDALHKFDKLTKAAGTMRQQLERILPDQESADVAMHLSMASRFMHLEGRPLLDALPRAVDDIEAYEWLEGEVLGGMVIGWNFGDGHLNDDQLLRAVQAQCRFDDGEVRVISVESQPMLGSSMHWKITDAAGGLIAEGETEIAAARDKQPWQLGSLPGR